MTLIGLMETLLRENSVLDFNILDQIVTSPRLFPSSSSISENDRMYTETCKTYSSILYLKTTKTDVQTKNNLQSESELLVRNNKEECVEFRTKKYSLPKVFIDFGRNLKDFIEKLNSLDLPIRDYEDDNENSLNFSVNEPPCGTGKVGKLEAFTDKKNLNSSSLKSKSETSGEKQRKDKAEGKGKPSFPSSSKIKTSGKSLSGCIRPIKNPEEVKTTKDVSKSGDNKPLLIDNDECTNYYLTSNITAFNVICKKRLEVDDPWIVHCKITTFTCNFCGTEFHSRDGLFEHKMLEHVGYVPSRNPVYCKLSRRYCIVSGYNRSYLQYKCSHCQRKFKSIGDYGRHCNDQICRELRGYLVSPLVRQCRLDNGEIGFECWLCQESSEAYVEMKFHECIVRRPTIESPEGTTSEIFDDPKEKEPYKCFDCGLVLYDKQHFISHMLDHANDRRFECKICFRSYTRPCNLKKHMETHNDENSKRS